MKNIKVSDLCYRRVELDEIKKAFDLFFKRNKQATCADDVLSARKELLKATRTFSTFSALAYTRYTLNTADEFYLGEQEYYDEISPEVGAMSAKYAEAMLKSPYRKELEKALPETVYPGFELDAKCHSEQTIELEQTENALVTEYSNMMASLTTEWRGEQKTISFIRGYLSDDDRAVRAAAANAIGKALSGVSDKLDDLFDKLVKTRTEIAKKLGFDNFIELGYARMGRIDYNEKEISEFRKNVCEHIVPVVSKLKNVLAAKMGITDFSFYDNEITDGENPRPYPDAKGILAAAKEMYHEMKAHPLGDFFDDMLSCEAFDTESRANKWGGGYATSFDDFRQPFILANFNGQADDVDVVTHEFGHTVAMTFAFDHDPEAGIGSSETAETHSMSMEFLAWKFMDKFFKDADEYRKKHLASALTFIPYGVIIDEFQHRVYAEPDMSPARRNEVYLELERKYRPYLTFDGIEYLEKGTRWQFQMHVYETPFYYIDYCLAQVVALEFLELSLSDYDTAVDKYLEHAKCGGNYPFKKLISLSGLSSPFEAKTLSSVAEVAVRILSQNK